jgi:hypothetical protein
MERKTADWLVRAACAALLAAPLVAAPRVSTERSSWAPETLQGTITMVDPAQHILVVQDASGVPFDMVVTHATNIRSGGHEMRLRDLHQDINQNVSVRFIPERRGDIARSIQLTGAQQ